jgi:hypothetical protein
MAVDERAKLDDIFFKAMGKKPPKFVSATEEPDFLPPPYTGLDLTRIPATPDILILEGFGLKMFLLSGKAFHPSYMSYGRALKMFGTPKYPGEPYEGPRTEREYREKNCSPTKSILEDGVDPWEFIRGFAEHIPMITAQYVELVRAKENGTSVHGYIGWPAVEGLDFDGFVNWVKRCTDIDPDFLTKTVPAWQRAEDAPKERLVRRLTDATALLNFTDAQLGFPPATEYYRGESLLEIDKRRLGLKD